MDDCYENTIPAKAGIQPPPVPCPDASGRVKHGMVRGFSFLMVRPACGMDMTPRPEILTSPIRHEGDRGLRMGADFHSNDRDRPGGDFHRDDGTRV
jgi:hypothetical protein